MNRSIAAGTALLVLVAFTPTLHAQTRWKEKGDAGDLPATAQETRGRDPLLSISGKIDRKGDVDMYCVYLPDPKAFKATTVGTPGTLVDTQLYLFESNGIGVAAADDVSKTDLRSTLSIPSSFTGTLDPGEYYLAISAFDQDPLSTTGYIFPNTKFIGVQTATGPGGANPVIKWSTTGFDSGSYTINLTNAQTCAVPEFSSFIIFSICAVTVVGMRSLRRRPKVS